MSDEEILGKIKKAVSELVEDPPMGILANDTACIYLMFQILDRLESIDERLNNIYWDAREYHEQ